MELRINWDAFEKKQAGSFMYEGQEIKVYDLVPKKREVKNETADTKQAETGTR